MLEGENAVADVNAEFQDANLNKEKNAENEFRQEQTIMKDRISEEQISEFHRILHFDEAYSELSAIFDVIF